MSKPALADEPMRRRRIVYKLRVAMDAGARRVLIPTENSRDFAQIPAEVLDKLRIEFYSEPSQAAFKALAE